MEGFLQTALSFPTVLFSFLLILAIIYWGIVALGMVEIDVLDLDAESVVDGAGQAEGLAALLAKLKLNGVPVTLVLTLLSFFAWFLCYFVQLWLLSALSLGWLRYPLGAVVAVGALFLAAPLAATLCRPLRPLFRKLESTSSKSVLGQVAVVRSGRVTLQHGEALLEDGGAGLILKVRAEETKASSAAIASCCWSTWRRSTPIGSLPRKSSAVSDPGSVRIKENCCYGYDVADAPPAGSGPGRSAGRGPAGPVQAFYIKVPQGTALIVNDMSSTPKVHFTGALVYPVIHLKEFMRISLITLEVDRRGKDGLICRDNMRADITVAFYLRVRDPGRRAQGGQGHRRRPCFRPFGGERAVQCQVLRGAEDRRQAVRLRPAVRESPGLP